MNPFISCLSSSENEVKNGAIWILHRLSSRSEQQLFFFFCLFGDDLDLSLTFNTAENHSAITSHLDLIIECAKGGDERIAEYALRIVDNLERNLQ
jgi:hypothetical protein